MEPIVAYVAGDHEHLFVVGLATQAVKGLIFLSLSLDRLFR